jgi:lysophospholipase L1-like esterase
MVVFSAITTMVVLTILEGGSRLVGHVEYPPDPLFEGQQSSRERNRQYDPLLFWRLRPNRHSERLGQVTNSLGLRGPEVPAKTDDEFRILSLGESTTYGWKVAYEDCYSALLETHLDSVEGKQVRVVNAGVPGYTVVQGYVYLKFHGVDLEPDAVLLYFGYNDFLDVAFREKRVAAGKRAASGVTDLELFNLRRRFTSRLRDWTYQHSNLARLVGSLMHGAKEPAPGGPGEPAAAGEHGVRVQYNMARVPEDDRRTALEGILDLCETRGIDLVVIVPWYLGFDEHVPLLRRFASEHGVTIVDLPSILTTVPGPKQRYFRDSSHPNEEGHKQIAMAVADVIRGSRGIDD